MGRPRKHKLEVEIKACFNADEPLTAKEVTELKIANKALKPLILAYLEKALNG